MGIFKSIHYSPPSSTLGVSKYLEDFVDGIDAPLLDRLGICFFDRILLIYILTCHGHSSRSVGVGFISFIYSKLGLLECSALSYFGPGGTCPKTHT